MFMFSHTVIPLGKMVVGTFEFHSKGSIIKGWQGGWHCLSTGCVEGTVIVFRALPAPFTRESHHQSGFISQRRGLGLERSGDLPGHTLRAGLSWFGVAD